MCLFNSCRVRKLLNQKLKVKISGDGAKMSRNTNYIVLSFAVLNEGEEVLTSKGEQNGVTLGETKKVFSLSTFFWKCKNQVVWCHSLSRCTSSMKPSKYYTSFFFKLIVTIWNQLLHRQALSFRTRFICFFSFNYLLLRKFPQLWQILPTMLKK